MTSSQAFQSQVNQLPAPGVEGGPASLNPSYYWPAGPGGMVAGDSLLSGGAGGVLIGRWAWADQTVLNLDNQPVKVNNYGTGLPLGLLPNNLQGAITVYLQEASLLVPSGLPIGVLTAGDRWVVNRGTTKALIGQKAYATFLDGSTTFAATGSVTAGATSTGSTVTPETFSVTGSVAGNVMTVTAVGSGTVYPGATVSGTGITSGAMVVSQLTPLLAGETAGGVGRYALSIGDMAAASTTISGTYGLLTLGTVTNGPFAVNDVITGGSVVAGTVITASVTGGGTGGTMIVNNNTNVGSAAINVAAVNVETGWYCQSSGAPGELVKISRLP